MKSVPFQVEACHLRVRDFLSLGVATRVEFASHLQSMSCPCGADQIHDDRQTFQRPSSPVPTDEGKQSVLDLVPLAGSRRKMTHRNRQTHLVSQSLQFPLPQAGPRSIASARIGCDQQGSRFWVGRPSHGSPPPSNALDRKGRRVMIDSNAHPALIAFEVIHAIGNGLSLPRNNEVVNPYSPGTALPAPFPARILEISNQFLLLRIHRNNRLAGSVVSDCLPIDVFELRIAVRVLFSFPCFAIGLQTVALSPQDLSHDRKTHGMSHLLKPLGQETKALGRPSKRRFRVSSCAGFHQRLQVRNQPGVLLHKLFATSPQTADSRRIRAGHSAKNLFQTLSNGAACHPRNSGDHSDAAISQCFGFGGRINPPAPFVQRRRQSQKFLFQRFDVHPWDIGGRRKTNKLFIYNPLVCASLGCPILRSEPYIADNLDFQLNDQISRFLADPKKFRYDADIDTIRLSPIFKWFKKDFERAGGIILFLKAHLPKGIAGGISEQTKIEWLDYDWSLNERKGVT
jgi:hypothetical protein